VLCLWILSLLFIHPSSLPLPQHFIDNFDELHRHSDSYASFVDYGAGVVDAAWVRHFRGDEVGEWLERSSRNGGGSGGSDSSGSSGSSGSKDGGGDTSSSQFEGVRPLPCIDEVPQHIRELHEV
jgi:hypothetical protein